MNNKKLEFKIKIIDEETGLEIEQLQNDNKAKRLVLPYLMKNNYNILIDIINYWKTNNIQTYLVKTSGAGIMGLNLTAYINVEHPEKSFNINNYLSELNDACSKMVLKVPGYKITYQLIK